MDGVWVDDGWFDTRDVPKLTNRDRPSIVLTIGCSTAEQFGPAFVNSPNGGAVAYIGTRFMGGSDSTDFARQFYAEALGHDHGTIGEAFAHAQIGFVGAGGSPWTAQNWRLQGDPALVLLPEETTKDLQVSTPHGCEQYDLGVDVRIYWNASGTDFGKSVV